MRLKAIAIGALLAFHLSFSVAAQLAPQKQEKQKDRVKKESLPALKIGVVIEDENGNPIDNLKAENLEIYENEVRQAIETLTFEPAPLSLGIVIDTSGSMKKYLNIIRAIAAKIISLKKPDDEIFLAQFKAEAKLMQEFTRDTNKLEKALEAIFMTSGSVINDALVATSDYAKKKGMHSRKAILLITDGAEKRSSFDFKNVEKVLAENNIRVFILVLPYKAEEKISPKEFDKNKEWYNYLVTLTGGEIYFPTPEVDLMLFINRFLGMAQRSYLLSYHSTNQNRGDGLRMLKIELPATDKRKVNITSRQSYSVPK